jgi:hypothetical protein
MGIISAGKYIKTNERLSVPRFSGMTDEQKDAEKIKALEQRSLSPTDLVEIKAKSAESSVPKPSFIYRWKAALGVRIGQAWRWFKKNILGFFYRPFVSKADKTIEEILNEKCPERVSKENFIRPTTGVSQSKQLLTPQSPIARNYAEAKYLNQENDYGLKWSPVRIVRDALQNFYDGQGQQLNKTGQNATTIEVKDKLFGKKEIKISASANYDAERLLSIGSTTKKDSNINTGGFGEGAKQMAFSLLRDYGVEKVTFRSREWQVDFTLQPVGEQHSALDPNKKGLHAKLSILSQPITGNELTFQVDGQRHGELVQQFLKGRDLFYHDENSDLKNATYENEVGGFKLISGNEEPHFYHAGQRRGVGYGDEMTGLTGYHLWTNRKQVQEVSRDRGNYDERDAKECLAKVINQMSTTKAVEAMNVLTPYWFPPKTIPTLHEVNREETNKRLVLDLVCKRLAELNKQERNAIDKMPSNFKLPDGLFISDTNPGRFSRGSNTIKLLKSKGYIPVDSSFKAFNIPYADDKVRQLGFIKQSDSKTISILSQTEKDKARIGILKDVIKQYSKELPVFQHLAGQFLTHPWEIIEPKSDYLKDRNPLLEFDPAENKIRVNPALIRDGNFPRTLSKLLHNNDLLSYGVKGENIQYWTFVHSKDIRKWQQQWDN